MESVLIGGIMKCIAGVKWFGAGVPSGPGRERLSGIGAGCCVVLWAAANLYAQTGDTGPPPGKLVDAVHEVGR